MDWSGSDLGEVEETACGPLMHRRPEGLLKKLFGRQSNPGERPVWTCQPENNALYSAHAQRWPLR
jgi:hypothetical protein